MELAGSAPVFDCQRCGHCCEGRGGIVLAGRDLPRLSAGLGMSPEAFCAEYGESRNGKLRIRCASDGFCVFYRAGQGCAVHSARPDVCRAWPFFRGNLLDRISLAMAAEDCPGISRQVSFERFRAEGLRYLETHGLIAGAGPDAPNALKIE